MALQENTKKLIEERNKVVDPTTSGAVPSISPVDFMKGMGIDYDPATAAAPSVLTVDIQPQHRSAKRRLGETYDPYFGDINEKLAQQQTAAERLAYMVPRIGTKVLSEVAQIPGYLGGLGMWAATGFDPAEIGQMVDNQWINAVQNAEEVVKDRMPVFTPKAVSEGSLMDNIFSSSFWANEGADGIGFLISMLVPGQAIKALKVGEGVAAIPRLVKPGFAGTQLAGKVNMMTAAAVNTVYESAAEAGETFRDMMQETGDNQVAGEAAAQTMKANFMILLGPNMLQQKWLFGAFERAIAGKGATGAAMRGAHRRMINNKTGALLETIAARPAWDKAANIGGALLKGTITEGFFEEGLQYASAEYAKKEATSGEKTGIVGDMLGTLDQYIESLTDTEMQKSIFLGAVLGGGMASISAVRDIKQEERLIAGQAAKKRTGLQKFIGLQDRKETKGLHSLLQGKYLARYRTYMDFVKKDEKGKPIIVDGKYELDPTKVKEGAFDHLSEAKRNKLLGALASIGDKEGFEYLKMQKDFNYMFPYLQQPGGLALLKAHINHLATADAEAFAEEFGIEPDDVQTIKKDLLDKAEKFQKVVNKVETRHDATFNVKHDPQDQESFEEFSSLIKNKKYSEISNQDHYIRRINALTDELTNYEKGDEKVPITREGDETWSEALKRQSKNLSQSDIDSIKATIKNIETHEAELMKSKTREKDLYNKAILQSQFNEYLDTKKEDEAAVEEAKQTTKKGSNIAQLDPALRGMYDTHVKHETLRVGIEDFDAKHSSEFEIDYIKDGEKQTLTASIDRATNRGDLQMKDKDGKISYLRADGTISIQGNEYKIEGEPRVTKDVNDLIKERQKEARLASLDAAINEFQKSINRNENEIKRGLDYIQELYERLEKLNQKELDSLEKYGTKLSRKGASRVESIQVLRGRGKRVSQMYLTTDQIKQEVEFIQDHLRRVENLRLDRIEKLESLEEEKAQVMSSEAEETTTQVLDSTIELIQDQHDQIAGFQEASLEALGTTQTYLGQMQNLLKGYNTTMARLLGITDRINFIRSSEMNAEQQATAEFDAIAAALHAQGPVTDEFNEVDGTLDNILNVRQKIANAEAQYTALYAESIRFDDSLERLNTAIKRRNAMRNKYLERYRDYLNSLGLLSSNIDKEAAKNETKEGEFENMNSNFKSQTKDFEEGYKHPFEGTESWFVTVGNQQALTNPEKYNYTDEDLTDMSRWYVFVNRRAYEPIRKGDNKGKKRFLLRSFSYDIVGTLDSADVLRTNLKFWAGKEHGYKSYNELQELPEEARETASDDIKVVVYDRISGKPKISLSSKAGSLNVDNKRSITFTSLPSGELTTANAKKFAKEGDPEQRFSITKFADQKLKELMEEAGVTEATDKLKEEAINYAQAVFEKSAEDFKESREALKEVSMFFNIDATTPGVKEYDDAKDREIEESTGIKAVAMHITAPNKREASIKISGTRFPQKDGYFYVTTNNRVEAIKPKTLGETDSVDAIVNLFRYLAEEHADSIAVEKYIKSILNMNNSETPFRLAFVKAPQQRTFSRIVFGDQGLEVTKEQLLNNEGLAEFKEFLKNKYWNFSFKGLKSKSFTEYQAVEKKGKLALQSRVWDKTNGGYKSFLFSPTKNKTKGTIYVSPRAENDSQATRNPQYKNQALLLSEASTDQEIEGTVIADEQQIIPAETLFGGKAPAAPAAATEAKEDANDAALVALGLKPPTPTAEQAPPAAKKPEDLGDDAALIALGLKSVPETIEDVPKGPTKENTSDTVLKEEQPVKATPSAWNDAESYWKYLEKTNPIKYNYYKNRFPSEQEAQDRAFRQYQEQRSEGGIYREARKIARYKRADQAAESAWFQDKFPDFPMHVVEGLIDGKAWGQFYAGTQVLISDLAAEGTTYHEAYHVVSKIFLTEEERAEMYAEIKGDYTDVQKEEILAEEFREYMMANGNYKFGKAVEAKKNYFQRILSYLMHMFNRIFGIQTETPSKIAELFDKINKEEFSLKDRKSWSTETLNRRVEGATEAESVAYVKDINFKFFKQLFGPTAVTDEKLIFRLTEDPTVANEIYKAVYDDYHQQRAEELMAEGKDPNVDPAEFYSKENFILKNWKDITDLHRDYMLQYKIDIRDEIDEEERSKDTYNWTESNTTSMNNVAPRAIRLTIAGLPSVTRTGEGKVDLSYTDFDTNSTVAYEKIMNILKNNLSNVDTLFGMLDKLNSLKLKYPELGILLQRLGNPTTENLASLSDVQFKLLAQLYKGFSLNKNTPMLYLFGRKGRKTYVNAVDHTNANIIQNDWLNDAKTIANAGGALSLIKKDKGNYIVDKAGFIEAAKATVKLKKDGAKLTAAINLLRRTGLITTDIASVTNLKPLIEYIKATANELYKSKQPVTLQDLFDGRVIESQGETKRLLEYFATLLPSDSELMFINQDGKPEYSITLPSHISNNTTRLNEWAMTGDDSQISHVVNIQQNPLAWHSEWLKQLKAGEKLELILLRGGKSRTVSRDTSTMNVTDYKSMIFNNLLQNIVPLLRAADRKLEYGFFMNEVDGLITNDRFFSTALNYLKDELYTSFAFLREGMGTNLANYRNHADSLRSFDYLYDTTFTKGIRGSLPDLSEFVQDNGEMAYGDLVEKFISENKDFLSKAIMKYINKTVDLNLESLKESSVIMPTKKDSWAVPGIDPDLVSKLGIEVKQGRLSKENMRQVAKLASYNYFVGAQEQLKLIFGDLAMYKSVADFHKRTTGAASTKNKLINDYSYVKEIEARYPRFDGYGESFNFNKVVYDDITKPKGKVDADVLKVSKKYATANGVDAQVWASMDGYRSLLIRDASWHDGHEATYQYEMQKLGIKLLEDAELRKIFDFSASEFTATDGIFYNHTNGEIPKTPMMNGKEITFDQMTPLPPLKPQGFGHIADQENLLAPQFYKLSMAPVFPSLLEGDMLKHHLSMLANGVDAFGFVTADKATYKLNEQTNEPNQFLDKNGNVQLMEEGETTTMQSMSYDDFGIQLEIAEDPKGRVSRSTQRERLEYNDVYEHGDPVMEDDTIEEYYNTIQEIARMDFKALVARSGITKKSDNTYELTEENAEKFGKFAEDLYTQREMPYNLIDGIHEVLKSDLKLFDALVNKNKIEEVLLAVVKNNIIRRKTTGEMLVQESSYLYYGDELEFYKKGKDATEPMEVVVPLPKAWMGIVQAKGGLNYLNGLIEKKNYAKIREEFGDLDRALLLSGERIPVQGLNSMEAMRIKKFMPSYVGNKILMPHEVTVKAGSDFDIDKLTTYFAKLVPKNGKLVYVEDGKGGLENKLNELSFKALTNPAKFKDLLTPNQSDTIFKIADDIVARKEKTELEQAAVDEGWSKATQLWYNFQKAEQFWGAKAGIALAASQNKSIPTHQQNPVAIEDANARLFFEQQELAEHQKYISGHIHDSEGKKISLNFSEFLTAFVDAAKDPRVFELNVAIGAFNLYAFLNKFGKNTSVGLETIAGFMTQPIVLTYLQQSRNAKSNTVSLVAGQFKNDIVDRRFKALKAAGIKGVPSNYEQTLAASYEEYFNAPAGSSTQAVHREKIEAKLKKYEYEYLTKSQLAGKLSAKQQVQILDNFLMYETFATQLGKLNQVSNGDARMEQNLNSLEAKFAMLDELKTNGFFNAEDIDDFMNANILAPFNEVREETRKVFSWAFISKKSPIANAYFNERFIKPFTKRIWGENNRARALRTIENDFVTFLIQTTGKTYEGLRTEYESMFFDKKKNGAKQLMYAKTQGLNNELVNELESIVEEYDRNTKEVSSQDYISSFNKRVDLFQQNSLTSAWFELLEHPKKGVVEWAKKLIKQGLYQSGVSQSPISYLRYAPNEVYIEMAHKALAEFDSYAPETQEALLRSFEEQMYRNNWNNTDIVPRRATPKAKYEDVWTPYKGRETNPDVRYMTRVFMRPGKMEGFYTVLYKRVYNSSLNRTEFVVVKKLGNEFKFKEYYPISAKDVDGPLKSLYATNNDEGIWAMEAAESRFEENPIMELSPDELLEDYSQSTGRPIGETGEMYGVESTELAYIEPDPELDQLAKDFFDAMGFEYEATEKIVDRFGRDVPKAVAITRMYSQTVNAVEGRMGIHHLPEEAAHIYLAHLDKKSGLYKSMMDKITGYEIYDRVKEEYEDIYDNEVAFKEEAIGQLISQYMVQSHKKDKTFAPELSDRQREQVKTWWGAMWAAIRRAFNLNNPFKRSAFNILNQRLDKLTVKAKELGGNPELYALDSYNWGDLFADKQIGNVKFRYFRTDSQAEEFMKQAQEAFGVHNISMSPAAGKVLAKVIIKNPSMAERKEARSNIAVAEKNFAEFKEEDTTSNSKAEVLDNFDKYYPSLEHLNALEKEAFVDALTLGEIEQVCGL